MFGFRESIDSLARRSHRQHIVPRLSCLLILLAAFGKPLLGADPMSLDWLGLHDDLIASETPVIARSDHASLFPDEADSFGENEAAFGLQSTEVLPRTPIDDWISEDQDAWIASAEWLQSVRSNGDLTIDGDSEFGPGIRLRFAYETSSDPNHRSGWECVASHRDLDARAAVYVAEYLSVPGTSLAPGGPVDMTELLRTWHAFDIEYAARMSSIAINRVSRRSIPSGTLTRTFGLRLINQNDSWRRYTPYTNLRPDFLSPPDTSSDPFASQVTIQRESESVSNWMIGPSIGLESNWTLNRFRFGIGTTGGVFLSSARATVDHLHFDAAANFDPDAASMVEVFADAQYRLSSSLRLTMGISGTHLSGQHLAGSALTNPGDKSDVTYATFTSGVVYVR